MTVHKGLPQRAGSRLKALADQAALEDARGKRKKTGGRQKGTPNKDKAAQESALADSIKNVFAELTEEEIQKITGPEVMRLCTIAAVRAGSFNLAMVAATAWAPYTHAKKAPVAEQLPQGPDANKTFVVVENSPDKPAEPAGADDDDELEPDA